VLLCASLCVCSPRPAGARPADEGGAAQIQQAIEQAVNVADAGAAGGHLSLRRRDDLERELSGIVGNPVGNVFFYEVQTLAPGPESNDSIWAVVAGDAERQSYGLYSFDSGEDFGQSSREFSRLMSRLALAIPDEQTVHLAQFYMLCCVRGDPGAIVADEDGLRHAVERHYLTTFGDTGRMLDAYSRWWHGYERNARYPTPSVEVEHGEDHVVVKRVLLVFGAHPRLQQFDLEVSHDGSVRVLAMGSIYPKGNRWLFYDFRSHLMSQTP
jgi:hypothetical protein